MISLSKGYELNTFKDWTDFLYLASFLIVIVVSTIYVVLTLVPNAWNGDYTPLLKGSPIGVFIVIGLVAMTALFCSYKIKSLRVNVFIALAYTVLILASIVILPTYIGSNFTFQLHTLKFNILNALLVCFSIFFIWLHAFYRNK